MLAKDDKGSELLEMIAVAEDSAAKLYSPINCCLGVVKLGDDYLMGWNKYRQDWEIFGGCREDGESLRACIDREGLEELGLSDLNWSFIGLMHCKMAPDYFNSEWHYEYGGIYGTTLPKNYLKTIEKIRIDREEIGKLALYGAIKGKEKVAPIDEKLLEYWQ